ncbi:MAG: family 2 glycosyl transferase [Nitrospirae bacterium]|nr:MAG: family 2 glycosyl transferase [Nitrospirota bacterium]
MIKKIINKRVIIRARLGFRYIVKYFSDEIFEAFNPDYSVLKPLDVVIERTYSCNLRCQTCFRWTSKPNEKELNFKEWTAVIEKLKNWIGTFSLSITGGEPFLREDMIDIINFATTKDITTTVGSNATLIDKKLAERIVSSGLDSLALSLNSVTPGVHNRMRGDEGNFGDVMRVIELLKNRGNMWLSLGTTIINENISELVDLAEFTRDKGLDGITFQPLMETSSLPIFDEKGESRQLPEGKYFKELGKNSNGIDEVFERLITMKTEGYPINNSARHLSYMCKYLKNPLDPEILKLPCKIGSKNFPIDPFGNVRICSLMEPIGNLRDDLPEKIWNSDKARNQRQMIRKCRKSCRILTCTFKNLDLGFKLRKLSRSFPEVFKKGADK